MAEEKTIKPTRLQTAISTKPVLSDIEYNQRILECFRRRDYRGCFAFVTQYIEGNKWQYGNLPTETLRAGAWSACLIGKYPEALAWAGVILDKDSDDVQLLFLQALVLFEFREFADCVKSGEKVVKLLTSALEDSWQLGRIKEWEARLYNCIGMSHYNLGNLVTAAESVAKAIAAYPDNPESYINLAQIKSRSGDVDGKRRAISDGLVYCADKRDLEKLATEFLGDERISLCMIVKNEEEMLAQCLESVSAIVDEIIVVDTGSEDRTVEIARRFGARVYHHPWEANFSLHRNQSIDYATGDWILIMDADEVLLQEDHDKLRRATRIPDMNVVSISVHNKHLRTGEITSFLPSVRLWRRKLGGRYEGIVHNELRLPASEPVLRADVRLIHFGYGLEWDKMKEKIKRSKTLLLKQLEENPNNAFANFNYSQILKGEEKSLSPEACQEILDHSGRAVGHTDPNAVSQRHIHLMALEQMATAYFYLKEYDKAEECIQKALTLEPDYIDGLFSLAHIYAGKRDFSRAISAYHDYIQHADSYDHGGQTQNWILQHTADQAAAYFSLGLIHEETQQEDQAIYYYHKIFDYKADHADVHTHLAMLHYRKEDYDKAIEHATKRIEAEPGDITARTVLAEIARRQKRFDGACAQGQAILERDPANMTTLELMVAVEREQGNQGAALNWIDRILTIAPSSYYGLNNKAEIQMALNHYDEAIEAYKVMAEHFPEDAEVFNNLGNCYFRLQDFAEAIRNYSRALTLKPQMAIALRNLGYTHYKAGDLKHALVSLANYLDYIPEDLDITYLVSRLHFDSRDYSNALRYAEQCVTIKPLSAELIAYLSDCYLKLGHVESARMGYRRAVALDPNFQPAAKMLQELETIAPTAAGKSHT